MLERAPVRLRLLLALAGGLALAAACWLPSACRDAARATAPPHVIVILADDLGVGDVGFGAGDGEDLLPRTPALDRLAQRSLVLERLYASPVCTPSRAALLTGRHPWRYGLQAGVLRPFSRWGLPREELTLAERLRAAGWSTALVGKWHLGHARRDMLPTARGFERQYGSYNGAIDHFTHERLGALDWHRDDRACRDEGYDTDLIGGEAVRTIDAHDPRRSLLLVVPFTAPHAPLQAPEEELAAFAALADPSARVHAAMVARMDRWIGRIVEALERRGMLGSALLLFASDNGADLEYGGSNGALRGDKKDLYEGALRVPGLLVLPGCEARRVPEPVHLVDLVPTALSLAGLEVPPDLDGLDLAPLARGQALGREALVLHVEPTRGALLRGPHKLVARGALASEQGAVACELFDLALDPLERDDRAAREPERVARLLAELRAEALLQAPPLGGAYDEREEGFVPPRVWGEQ